MKRFDVIAVGLSTVDILIRLPEEIDPGGKMQVKDLIAEGGGPAANAAAVPARLGYSTAMVARAGAGEFARLMRDRLQRYSIDDELLIDAPDSAVPVSVIQIDPVNSDRTIFYCLENYQPLSSGEVPIRAIQRARLLLVDAYAMETAVASLEAAHSAGIHSVLDFETGSRSDLERLLALATDAILPLAIARELTGFDTPEEALAELAKSTDAQLIVTDGTNGAWASLGGRKFFHQPAFAAKALDTTGCGDSYHGAYAVGLLEEWPLAQRMEFAAWIAAKVSEQIGGRAGLPNRDSLVCTLDPKVSMELRNRLTQLVRNE